MRKTKRMLEIEKNFGKPIEDLLREFYWDKRMSSSEISKVIACVCVGKWMKKLGIPRRKHTYRSTKESYSYEETIRVFNEFREGKRKGFQNGFWKKNREERIRVIIRYLIEEEMKISVDEIPSKLTSKKLRKYCLGGLVKNISMYEIMNITYPNKFKIWNFQEGVKWSKNKKLAKEAVKWLMEDKLRIPIDEIANRVNTKTFKENGLWGMLQHAFNSSYINAIMETYPDKFRLCDFNTYPQKYWHGEIGEKHIRDELMRVINEKNICEEDIPKIVNQKFLTDAGLSSLFKRHSVYDCVNITYPNRFRYEEFEHIFYSSKKIYVSNHGHKFRSMIERDVDNFLGGYNIKHKHDVKYPNSNRNCDIVVGNKYWIEVAGIKNISRYDDIMEIKKEIADINNLNLIIIDYYDKLEDWKRKLSLVINEFGITGSMLSS